MLYSNQNPIGLIGTKERDKKAASCLTTMAETFAEAWRMGECRAVKESIMGVKDPEIQRKLKEATISTLLPTERTFFNQYFNKEAR